MSHIAILLSKDNVGAAKGEIIERRGDNEIWILSGIVGV
jgi:hypothetical protein